MSSELSMHACVRACMHEYIRTRACMHTYIHRYTHTHTHARCQHTNIHTYTHIHTHTHTHTRIHIYTHTRVRALIHPHIFMHEWMHVYVKYVYCTSTSTHFYAWMNACIPTYTTHLHPACTRTHAWTHTHALTNIHRYSLIPTSRDTHTRVDGQRFCGRLYFLTRKIKLTDTASSTLPVTGVTCEGTWFVRMGDKFGAAASAPSMTAIVSHILYKLRAYTHVQVMVTTAGL
jgi:hypothetical protein